MNAKEVRQLSPEALRARAQELFADIISRRFGGIPREKNNKKLRALRRERARVLTILREKGEHQTP